jgi:arylsulfatase A-like enzyme
MIIKKHLLLSFSLISTTAVIAQKTQPLNIERNSNKPLNVIFILSDDHRYDFMGFTGKVPWLKTPNMDKMAKEGVWIKNATVTTSLCSPSRASILTGMYAHKHTVVDNSSPLPPNLIFFPQYLQQAGYRTAFFG